MIYFTGTILETSTVWEVIKLHQEYEEDAICINFPLPIQLDRDVEALNYLKAHLQTEEYEWLSFDKEKAKINLDVFKRKFGSIFDPIKENFSENDSDERELIFDAPESRITSSQLTGVVDIEPEFSHRNVLKETQTTIRFIITYDIMNNNKPKRIFLSHKSLDKAMVRRFRDILKSLGFEPWMDENDILAGDKLHRSLKQGMEDSCAVVFFLTPQYIDEKFLAKEIDMAMKIEIDRGTNFKIITLVFKDDNKETTIPALLEDYVYKFPTSELEALSEILNALPLKLPTPVFK